MFASIPLNQAGELAESLRKSIEKSELLTDAGVITLTASFGVAIGKGVSIY